MTNRAVASACRGRYAALSSTGRDGRDGKPTRLLRLAAIALERAMKSIRSVILAGGIFLTTGFAVADEPVPLTLVVPVPDAEQGRSLFGAKGCVVCHSVNGLGGKAGPALDTTSYDGEVDPLDFAARMWSGARAMAVLQALEFGYQIDLTGKDITDLAAFVSSDDERSAFSEDDVPDEYRGWTLDAVIGALGDPATEGTVDDVTESITRGYVFSERWCSDCHVVHPGSAGGINGPPFETIARRSDITDLEIRNWLAEPHSKMPEFLNLTDTDLAAVASYIMSLRR